MSLAKVLRDTTMRWLKSPVTAAVLPYSKRRSTSGFKFRIQEDPPVVQLDSSEARTNADGLPSAVPRRRSVVFSATA